MPGGRQGSSRFEVIGQFFPEFTYPDPSVVPKETFKLKLEGMPPTVSLKPGEMKIEFFGAEDLFRQWFEIAQGIKNDFEKFSGLVEG